jgi:glyoxylase-like metal-dependent hydrolase (beta-lactamase superfamily II)
MQQSKLILAFLCWFLVCCAQAAAPPPLTRNRQLESLETAVSWPSPDQRVVVTLANELMATRRDREGFEYFEARTQAQPSNALFLALNGVFQARLAPEIPLLQRTAWVEAALAKLDRAVKSGGGLERFLRGSVCAELPTSFNRAQQAADDLEWMLKNSANFPPGLRRGAFRGLSAAYAKLGRRADAEQAQRRAGSESAPFLTDYSVSGSDGSRFAPPRLDELPGGIYIASGFDFADIAFVTVEDGIVAIDAGTTEANARAALAALRQKTTLPLRAVIVTHAHWDHIGGIGAFIGPGVGVIAQAHFASELSTINTVGAPFRYFFGSSAKRDFSLAPQHLVAEPEVRTIGGRRFGLYPAHGGETEDALLVHLPDADTLFVGDAFMPYLGAPFVAEGSVDGILDTIAQVRALAPKKLIHGHPPLTLNFTAETMAPLGEALGVVRAHALAGVRDGRALADTLGENLLPESLAPHPDAVLPFFLLRDHLIQRVYQQRTGYWKSDGEGMEVFTRAEFGRAADLLADGDEARFVKASRTLNERGDFGMALHISNLGLSAHPSSPDLAKERRAALDGLRLKFQIDDPFKLIIYSEMVGEGVGAVPPAP